MAGSRIARFLVRSEPWLPLAIGAAWWAAMYPGLYGEDSLMTLDQARNGPVGVWFTAWWIYVIRFVTLGTHAIPLITLFGVLTLTFSIRYWASAVFPPGPIRALSIALVCASPMVGAFGIQVRHDVEMTAGLLLCAAVLARLADPGARLRAIDVVVLAAAALLTATRHNGMLTVVGAALATALIPQAARKRQTLTLLAVAAGILVVTQVATRAAGQAHSADPIQTIEWALTDISCLVSKPDVRVAEKDWAYLTKIASRADWPQPAACRFMDKVLSHAGSFQRSALEADPGGVLRVWLSLAVANPAQMIAAHAERVRLFLPPFVAGVPRMDNLPFIHSTILPNALGLQWAFPRVAETVRLAARAWNALAIVIANAGLWLLLLVAVSRRRDARGPMRPTIHLAVVLELGILVAAPMSEGRYGLFILITGQLATLIAGLAWCARKFEARHADVVGALVRSS